MQALARELHQEGVSLIEIYHYFDTFRQFLGRHGRYGEEAMLGDCLNCILGFCSPQDQWFETELTHEEIEAYQNAHETRVILSGCSGGGKSTLLEELARRGYATFPEPGRLVVQEQLALEGDGLPWEDAIKFTELCAQKSIEFYDTATKIEGPVFFDRSPFDHLIGLNRLGMSVPAIVEAAVAHSRYHTTVFLVPPWEEIYATDTERRHSFADALEEYDGLLWGYRRHQFRVVVLPKTSVAERADIVEREIKAVVRYVKVSITRYVDTSTYPGLVECVLEDATGQKHYFHEKPPIVSEREIEFTGPFPQPGTLPCVAQDAGSGSSDDSLVEINTEYPVLIESTMERTRFTVHQSQLSTTSG